MRCALIAALLVLGCCTAAPQPNPLPSVELPEGVWWQQSFCLLSGETEALDRVGTLCVTPVEEAQAQVVWKCRLVKEEERHENPISE